MAHVRLGVAAVLGCVLVAAAACGKKGAPLAPIIHVPSAVEGLTARRVGDAVFLSVPVPTANVDGSMPPDVRRIEVYATTANAAPPRSRFLEIATLVGTVDVPRPDPLVGPGARVASTSPPVGTVPGAALTLRVRDRLTPEALTPRALAPIPGARAPVVPPAVAAPFARDQANSVPQRFYMAIPFNDRGRPGPPSSPIALALDALPEAPHDVRVTYTPTRMLVEWDPSGGIVGFLLEAALPLETLDGAPIVQGAVPASGPTLYHVYREVAPDPRTIPGGPLPPGDDGAPVPVSPVPVIALSFSDDVEFDRERCYQIRAVRGAGAGQVEGPASPRRCVTPVDTFPPARPTGLSAVAAAGSISLIWEPSLDADTAGYLILRGSGADATLQPVTRTPVFDTRYADRDVTPGVRYVYAVVAVDARVPVPNVSDESSRVEETAR
jgi:hypothetical protein